MQIVLNLLTFAPLGGENAEIGVLALLQHGVPGIGCLKFHLSLSGSVYNTSML